MERKNLWAPWRMKYIQGLSEDNGCFLCHDRDNPNEDNENLVLWRTEHSLVVFNRFPYNNGHLLIAPKRHIADLFSATQQEMLDMTLLIRDCQKILQEAVKCHGFNVGLNLGRCAGAGLPGHMHYHVVPRWNGDTNFMAVFSDTDVISQGMQELYELLVDLSSNMNLPVVNNC